MSEALLVRKGGVQSTLTGDEFSASSLTTPGSTQTINSGNVGAKTKAFASAFLVGSNTNTPTITVIFYGSNDGTNFTEIGRYTLQKTGTVTSAVAKIEEFDATGYTYFRLTGSGVSSGHTFGHGITLSLV